MKLPLALLALAGGFLLLTRRASGLPPGIIDSGAPTFAMNPPTPAPTLATQQSNLAALQARLQNTFEAAVAPYQEQLYAIPYGAVEATTAANQTFADAQAAFAQTPVYQSLTQAIADTAESIRQISLQAVPQFGTKIRTENSAGTPSFLGYYGPNTVLPQNILSDILAGRFQVLAGNMTLGGTTYGAGSSGWAYV